MRFSIIGLIAVLSLNFTACQNHKDLNPKLAKSMVQERLDGEPNRTYVPLDGLNNLFKKDTILDYRTSDAASNDLPGVVRRLIDAGFVSVTEHPQEFPYVTGTYRSTVQFVNAPFEFHVTLESHPGSPAITGSFYTINGNSRADGTMTGHAHEDGQVDLTWQYPGNINSTLGPYTYKIDTSNGSQRLSGPSPVWYGVTFIGTKDGAPNTQKVSVPMYSYAFTSKLKVDTVNQSEQASLGRIVVTEVNDLLLTTDTVATGKFPWKFEYNSFGEAITQSKQPNKTGLVQFGKQPDGTWVVTQIDL
jgi:hypothetical protein